LIRYALFSYREISAALPYIFPKLWPIFITAVADPLIREVTCLFDAFDECSEQEQPMLIKALEDSYLYRLTLSFILRLKFLMTSRPYFDIKRRFNELLKTSTTIEFVNNDESAIIKKEIDLIIKHRITELARENRLPKKVRDHLEKRLLETEHRTYL